VRDRAARTRTGLSASPRSGAAGADPRIHVSAAQLRALEPHASALRFLPRQPAASILNGRHASRLRGRGLNFEELRGYLPGDDPRTIDWKVTARTGEPHVRVYSEERDRPALLIVDQRMSMFFGTVHAMKSVTAAEAAALSAFTVLNQGDRVGGIIFGDEELAEIVPKAGKRGCDRYLAALVRANSLLSADRNPGVEAMKLNDPLSSVARIAGKNHLIIIISDFDGLDGKTGTLIGSICRHNDVVLCPVTDPISRDIPDKTRLVVSDGELQVELDTGDREIRQRLEGLASGRLSELLTWQRRYGLSVLPLSAGEETLPQVLRLLGRRPSVAGPSS